MNLEEAASKLQDQFEIVQRTDFREETTLELALGQIEAACKFGLAPEYTLSRARMGGWMVGRLDPAGLAAKLVQ